MWSTASQTLMALPGQVKKKEPSENWALKPANFIRVIKWRVLPKDRECCRNRKKCCKKCMEIIKNIILRMKEKMVSWHSRHVSARMRTHARTCTHKRKLLVARLQPLYDRYRLASDRWGRSSVSLLLYGCTERHAFVCMSNLCSKTWHFSFFQGYTCIFPNELLMSCLTMPSLISSW